MVEDFGTKKSGMALKINKGVFMLKNFKVYLERVQKQENSIVEKINEIIDFKKNIKKEDINSEIFTFIHYPEGQEFSTEVYSSIEGSNDNKVSTIEDLLKEINNNSYLLTGKNSLSYTIDYNKDNARIQQSFSKEKEEIKKNDQYSYSSSDSEVFSYKK